MIRSRPELNAYPLPRHPDLLLLAFARNELILHYQPYIDLGTHKIVGVEVLLRWQHPLHGLLYPAAFLPFAERSGSIAALGELVILKACAQMKEWQTSGIKLPSISVNVSPRQFDQSSLPVYVHTILTQMNLAPELLDIEITESSMPRDPDKMYGDVAALRSLGVKISIDDFGLGYSNLERLRMMRVDRIKIDRVFVSNLVSNPVDQCLVKAMIFLSQQLGVSTVAEGIEKLDTLDILRSMGCEQGQGFYFAPALSAADFERYLVQTCTDSTDLNRIHKLRYTQH